MAVLHQSEAQEEHGASRHTGERHAGRKAARVIAAYAFVAVAVLLCGLACLAILKITDLALSGSEGIQRHGLHRGVRAPRWSLADSSGITRNSPSATPLQLIVFADHSLKSFPSVV